MALLENNSWAPGGWGWGLAINGVQIEKLSLLLSPLLTINAVRIYLEIETLPMSLSPHKPGSAARHQRRSLSANIRVISSPTVETPLWGGAQLLGESTVETSLWRDCTVWRLHCGETQLCGNSSAVQRTIRNTALTNVASLQSRTSAITH